MQTIKASLDLYRKFIQSDSVQFDEVISILISPEHAPEKCQPPNTSAGIGQYLKEAISWTFKIVLILTLKTSGVL